MMTHVNDTAIITVLNYWTYVLVHKVPFGLWSLYFVTNKTYTFCGPRGEIKSELIFIREQDPLLVQYKKGEVYNNDEVLVSIIMSERLPIPLEIVIMMWSASEDVWASAITPGDCGQGGDERFWPGSCFWSLQLLCRWCGIWERYATC